MVYQMYRLQKERRKMISFVECSMAMQDFLMILLEICMILELILLKQYKSWHHLQMLNT